MDATTPDELDQLGPRAVAEEQALGRMTLASQSHLRMATRSNYVTGACVVVSVAWWLLDDCAYARWAFCAAWVALAASQWLIRHMMRRSEVAFDTFWAAHMRAEGLRDQASARGIDVGRWGTAA